MERFDLQARNGAFASESLYADGHYTAIFALYPDSRKVLFFTADHVPGQILDMVLQKAVMRLAVDDEACVGVQMVVDGQALLEHVILRGPDDAGTFASPPAQA